MILLIGLDFVFFIINNSMYILTFFKNITFLFFYELIIKKRKNNSKKLFSIFVLYGYFYLKNMLKSNSTEEKIIFKTSYFALKFITKVAHKLLMTGTNKSRDKNYMLIQPCKITFFIYKISCSEFGKCIRRY